MRVDWAGDSSAFVTLHQEENKHIVLSSIELPTGCTIKPYKAYWMESRPSESRTKEALSSPHLKSGVSQKRPLPSTENKNSKKLRHSPDDSKNLNEQHFDVSDNWD